MEPALDFNPRTFKDFGTHVVVLARGTGKTVKRIDTRNRVRNFLQFGTPAIHALAQFAENLVFKRMDIHFRVADDGFTFLHLGSDVAFGVHRRLLADIFVGNRARGLRHRGAGHFDVVAEHTVVADLQARNSETFAFADFERSNPFAAVLDIGVHRVEFRIGTRANHAALANSQREVVVELA